MFFISVSQTAGGMPVWQPSSAKTLHSAKAECTRGFNHPRVYTTYPFRVGVKEIRPTSSTGTCQIVSVREIAYKDRDICGWLDSAIV